MSTSLFKQSSLAEASRSQVLRWSPTQVDSSLG